MPYSIISRLSVHPHACGEHAFIARLWRTKFGSSPRLWGTLLMQWLTIVIMRFIPTLVGNTWLITVKRRLGSVHPHACGEHCGWSVAVDRSYGSSPRLWGTQTSLKSPASVGRFIPTLVGNTALPSPNDTTDAVHPHACGEHMKGRFINGYIAGSSPRLWGTQPFWFWA